MAEADRLRWNERYAVREAAAEDLTPVRRLLQFEALLRPTAPAAPKSAAGPPLEPDVVGAPGRSNRSSVVGEPGLPAPSLRSGQALSAVEGSLPKGRTSAGRRRTSPLALDLACGLGRHALYLARLGYTVDAWDVSDVALDHLARAARDQGLAARIRPRQVDLDAAALPAHHYDLVVDTYFLDRRLFGPMQAALKPGGLLFVETLLATPQKPGRPDYYLQAGELRAAFPALTELFYQENTDDGWAALLARR
jgi:SAM-dependent methyltransferase